MNAALLMGLNMSFRALESCKAERVCTSCFDTSLCLHNLASQGQGETNTTWFTGVDIGAPLHTTSFCPTMSVSFSVPLHTFSFHMYSYRMNYGHSDWATEKRLLSQNKKKKYCHWSDKKWFCPELHSFNGTSVFDMITTGTITEKIY